MNKDPLYICVIRYFLVLFLISTVSPTLFAKQTDGQFFKKNQTKKQNILASSKTCFVWFEVNNTQHLKDYLLYANKWKSVGQPIITSRKHNVLQFTEKLLGHDIPIISGFKTYEFFLNNSIYDAEAWQEIARMARALSKITLGRPVILENEGAVKHLLEMDVKSIDYKRLYSVISQQKWPEIWFWYAPSGTKPHVQSMSLTIASAITYGIPDSHLIESSSAGYEKMKQEASSLNIGRTLVLDNDPLSIVYIDSERYRFWRYENISDAIKQAKGDRVIIYPGFADINKTKHVKENLKNGLCG